jgi:DNA-binding CsgD family transcriptional regulator
MQMIERDRELRFLHEMLADCLRHEGRIVTVSGVTASGKSELLHRFAEHAVEAGARLVAAAGSRAERALPLGIVRQLFRSAAPTSGAAQGLALLLEEGALSTTFAECESDSTDPAAAQMLNGLCMALLNLADQTPLVIAVDDVQYSDMASLQCLLYLARRVRSSRLMLLITEGGPVHARFRAELLSQPHCRHITLAPLSPDGVREMIAGHVDAGAAQHLADACHAITGGNPLLVGALIEDNWAGPRPARRSGTPSVGEAFEQAVLRCLYRGTPEMLLVAQALAVLGEPAPSAMLGQLLGIEAGAAAQASHALGTAGLLDAGRFRHEAVRAAVLKNLPADQRVTLHHQAARLLYSTGSTPSMVARHLIAAGRVDEPWELSILEEAAERALSDGEPRFAVECLSLACERADKERGPIIRAALARAQWRINPLTASRHLPGLVDAIDRGELTGRAGVRAVKHMLWSGRLNEALACLDQLDTAPEESQLDCSIELNAARGWLAYAHPPLLARIPRVPAASGAMDLPSVVVGPKLSAATVLAAALQGGSRPNVFTSAEQILQRSHLDDGMVESVIAALLAMIYLDRPDKAASWTNAMLGRAPGKLAPTWQALFTWVRAEIAVRQGDLSTARSLGQTALAEMPAQGWGIGIGGPLGTLVLATTAMGKYAEAGKYLSHTVPETMFQSVFGLHYLHARGRYDLALDRPYVALSNFQACGDLMTKWQLDSPALLPWRTDAARALILLSEQRKARELVSAQLNALGSRYPRSRGAALRVLGLTSDLRQRRHVLREAVDILQGAGDRLELAHALTDLSQTHYALGESNRARLMMRRAHRLAQECHADPLRRVLQPSVPEPRSAATETAPRSAAEMELSTMLSEAERRVAVLAAQGDTNREIARKLYITISTVEQHLTRIYRKLNVSRRSDLPVGLQLDT